MVNFLRTAVLAIIFFQVNLVFTQETRIIRIQSGGTVNFNINSFKKYEEGMVLNNWTLLAISFIDSVPSAATWSLGITALQPAIEGDYLGSDLALDLITINIISFGGEPLDDYFVNKPSGEYKLTYNPLIPTPIIENVPQGSFDDYKILISYSIGTGTGKVLNNPANYYYVDIEFILSRVP